MAPHREVHAAAAGRDRALGLRRAIVTGTAISATVGVGVVAWAAWASDSGQAAAPAAASPDPAAGQGATDSQSNPDVPTVQDPSVRGGLQGPRQAPGPAFGNQAPAAVSGSS